MPGKGKEKGFESHLSRHLHGGPEDALMAKVHHDPAAAPGGEPERVTVRLRDGRVLVAERGRKPDLREADSVIEKFRECARTRLDDDRVTALYDAISAMPDERPIADVLSKTV